MVTDWTVSVGLAEPPVAVPCNEMVCEEDATFNASSVRVSVPVILPAAVGVKLTGSVHDCPTASVDTEEADVESGQVPEAELSSVKPLEIAGLLPVDGTAKVSAEFPELLKTAVWGLSELVLPTAVDWKLKLTACVSTLRMRLLL